MCITFKASRKVHVTQELGLNPCCKVPVLCALWTGGVVNTGCWGDLEFTCLTPTLKSLPSPLSASSHQELSSPCLVIGNKSSVFPVSPRNQTLLSSAELHFFSSLSSWTKAPLTFPNHLSVVSKHGFSWSGRKRIVSVVFRGLLPSHGVAIQPCESI